jgi:glutathione S-transferase
MAKYLLVSFKTCPWVQRAAIALREKNIDFEFRHIEPDNRPDWFLAISPHKKVPVLRADDSVSLPLPNIWMRPWRRAFIQTIRLSAR